MRLGLIREVLKKQLPDLKIREISSGGGVIELSGIHAAMAALRAVQQTGVLKAEINSVLEVQALALSVEDHLTITTSVAERFKGALSELKTHGAQLIAALKDLIPAEDPNSIFIKLPDAIDLEGLSKWTDEIETTLQQLVVNDHIGGQVQLGQFDTGSRWLQVLVGTKAAVLLIGMIAVAAIKIQEAQIQLDVKKKAAEEFIAGSNNRIEIQNTLTEQYTALIEKETDRIVDETIDCSGVPSDDHEYRERVKHGIRKLQEWSERGLEIHPALTTPMEVGQLFPDARQSLEAAKLIQPKQLTDASKEPEAKSDGG